MWNKIKPQVLIGELMLGAIAIILVMNGHYEGAIGIAGVIGTTMKELIHSAEAKNQ